LQFLGSPFIFVSPGSCYYPTGFITSKLIVRKSLVSKDGRTFNGP
jgi:hypothetical protein